MTEGACAVDLATGGAVLLRVEPIDDAGHARWTLLRDALGRLRHRSLATLVDYGPLGASNRFEAWSAAGPWRGAAAAERRARTSVAAFLDGCGFAADASAGRVYRSASGAPVVVPAASAERSAAGDRIERADLGDCGIHLVDRSAASPIVEMLDALDGTRPTAIGICGPPGSGKSTLVLDIARAARLRGLVPVCARLLSGTRALRGGAPGPHAARDRRRERSGWRAWLAASTWTARPHVALVTTAKDQVAGAPTVAL